MSTVFGLFDILALLYILRSIQLSITIWRDWSNIRAEPLTARKKQLAEQAAFFIAVPVSVFIHELGHAVAVWITGGQVVEFQYRVFWGYVVPSGSFTPAQSWFIAIAGTIGSLLFGLAVWLLTRDRSSSSVRYFGLRAFRFQVFFSLIYYPVFTLFGFSGDWRTIYDFGATPLLSGITAVVHIGILALFWRGDRLGWFEAPSQPSVAAQAQFDTLQQQALAAPDDVNLQLSYIDALRRGGADRAARHRLDSLLRDHPQSSVAHLEMAALQSGNQAEISRAAAASAARAVELGLPESRQEAYALTLIGRYEMADNHLEAAREHFNAALDALAQDPPAGGATALQSQLLILRSQISRRQGEYDQAYRDLQAAQQGASSIGDTQALRQIEQELSVLNKHAEQDYYLPSSAPAVGLDKR